MRFARWSLVAAGILVAYALAASAVMAQRLADLPPRTRPTLDPLSTALGTLGILLAAVLYVWLGRRIARAEGSRAQALRAGALAGALAGAFGSVAQALALSGYLGGVLAGIGLPDWFLVTTLGLYAAFAACVSTAYGAVVCWLSFTLARK